MDIDKKTTVTYTLNKKELSRIVLKSIGLREELVDSAVFTVDSGGIINNNLRVSIVVTYNEDASGLE